MLKAFLKSTKQPKTMESSLNDHFESKNMIYGAVIAAKTFLPSHYESSDVNHLGNEFINDRGI